jgi:hypothetical protein
MQASGGDPPLDLAGAESQLKELTARDRAVLSPHQRPDRSISLAPVPRLVV